MRMRGYSRQATGKYKWRGSDLSGNVQHGGQWLIELGHHLGDVLFGHVSRPVQRHGGGPGGHKDRGPGSEAQVGAGGDGEARGRGVKTREGCGGARGGGRGPGHGVLDSEAHSQFILSSVTLSSDCGLKHGLNHRLFL